MRGNGNRYLLAEIIKFPSIPHHHSSIPLSFLSLPSHFLCLLSVSGTGQQGLQSVYHILSLLLLPLHTYPLFQDGVPHAEHHYSWMSSIWVLSSSLQPAPTQVPSMGCSPPGTVWVPATVTGPTRSLLRHGLPTGLLPPSVTSTCSGVGSPRGCLLHHELPWTAREQPHLPRSSQSTAGESLL